MLRVCHLTPSFFLPHGPSAGILAQIDGQDATRIRSSVWSMYTPPLHLDATALLASRGIASRNLGMSRSFLDVRVLFRLVAALREEKPDILHCHLLRANLYGRLAAAIARVPVVINTWRSVEPYMTSRGAGASIARVVESRTTRWVDMYVAVSERVRRAGIEALRVPAEKVVTIVNAVDLEPYRTLAPRAPHQDVVVATLGGLEPRKNHAWLLDALLRIPSVRLVIGGEGPERERLLARAQTLGVSSRVSLPGLVRDVPLFLRAADIFVMVSTAEGLPRAIMEAMAAELPVVTTDAGGAAEAVEHGVSGYVVPIGDMDAFVRVVTSLAEDRELRERVGAAARERAFALFDPKRMAAEYTRLYETLAAAAT